jgi:hypothetical protein
MGRRLRARRSDVFDFLILTVAVGTESLRGVMRRDGILHMLTERMPDRPIRRWSGMVEGLDPYLFLLFSALERIKQWSRKVDIARLGDIRDRGDLSVV